MAKARCFVGVQRVMHAHFRFAEGTREIEINWRIVNWVAAKNSEQLDRAALHLINKLT